MPASRAARRTPSAERSLPAKIAVGRLAQSEEHLGLLVATVDAGPPAHELVVDREPRRLERGTVPVETRPAAAGPAAR